MLRRICTTATLTFHELIHELYTGKAKTFVICEHTTVLTVISTRLTRIQVHDEDNGERSQAVVSAMYFARSGSSKK